MSKEDKGREKLRTWPARQFGIGLPDGPDEDRTLVDLLRHVADELSKAADIPLDHVLALSYDSSDQQLLVILGANDN